jgi:3-methylcrotonyl-CoA carboxylase alpha subunit
MTPLRTVLVANRGEIARRVFAACRLLGVRSVAVCSEPDLGSSWSQSADAVVALPGESARDTYLNIDAVLAAAHSAGADGIHPGYGFLSENADFADACTAAGIAFVGPSAAAMRALGSKVGARQAAEAAGVPVVPGVDGAGHSVASLATEAARIGYPVLIKASAGGGGRGMRVVRQASDFPAALQAAQTEALSAFGNDHMLLERYFDRVHHVEVQVLGDLHGHVVHCFERECSVQRRHQKLIEESPSPIITPALRGEMTRAAVALAQQVGYASAGTVEFLVDESGAFYLLEMNTRLQVEHPVTELVTGLDLAAWQIRIAGGEPLAFTQADLVQRGHAMECRIYAEDPARDFLPSMGMLALYRPPSGPGVRVDDGVASGSIVSPFYDALLAKVITFGWDRHEALARMRQALAETIVLGITCNIPYLQAVLDSPEFVAGEADTRFLDRAFADWQPAAVADDDAWLAMAALETLPGARQYGSEAGAGVEHPDPWATPDGWRNVP